MQLQLLQLVMLLVFVLALLQVQDFQEWELDRFLLLHLSIEDSRLNETPFITKRKKILHLHIGKKNPLSVMCNKLNKLAIMCNISQVEYCYSEWNMNKLLLLRITIVSAKCCEIASIVVL